MYATVLFSLLSRASANVLPAGFSASTAGIATITTRLHQRSALSDDQQFVRFSLWLQRRLQKSVFGKSL